MVTIEASGQKVTAKESPSNCLSVSKYGQLVELVSHCW